MCDHSLLGFQTTGELSPLLSIIGQERAVRSLEFGLDIEERGFNIFAAGPTGTGKTTAISAFLEEVAKSRDIPPDWCYVNNFVDPSRPRALQLPPGKGKEFKHDMRILLEEAKRDITRAFESEEYSRRQEDVSTASRLEREKLLSGINDRARDLGFLIQSTPVGVSLTPHKGGAPLTEEDMASIPQAERDRLREIQGMLEIELKQLFSHLRSAERQVNEDNNHMDEQIARYAMDSLTQELKSKYETLPEIEAYLNEVEADLVSNVDDFKVKPRDGQAHAAMPSQVGADQIPWRYEVNVIVDNSQTLGAPVVLEINPTHSNLLGRIDKESQFGALQTNLTMIRPGSLHRANGGFLVIRIEEILRDAQAWEGLKRSLKEQKIITEEMSERMGLMVAKSLSPEPIPLNVKTILVGSLMLYHALYAQDPDFVELFKVKAEFDSAMERNEENIKDYASFICALAHREHLLQMDRGGVSKLVEHSSRLAEDQTKLSTRFAEISDIVREASYWAQKEGSLCINASHMIKTIEEKGHRSGLIKEKILQLIQRGTISIDIEGEAIGQINGLAVVGFGDVSFGRPGRITVSIGAGREGLVDIERESSLGGRLHTKGVMILGGYLVGKFAQDIPLSLVARLTFEQSYEEIDGDSASSAELYALLSRLSDFPIRQGIAVTGSVNQNGQVQPIGGVNDKIEGFFYVCQAKGLNGSQGVMIPAGNEEHLMLNEEVVEAVRQGRFHIYSTSTIDEGIEILTGVKAGCRQTDGSFEEGSVNQKVAQRIKDMATKLRDFMHSDS